MSLQLVAARSQPDVRLARPLLVNLGCGARFHADWINLDLFPASPAVRRANFLAGIPLADGVAGAVYHSHVLEHLTPERARQFLGECRRVLCPGGILRVVVPDLEQSVRDYLSVLDARRRGEPDRMADHHWMLVELLDQLARTVPGGEFVRFARQARGNDHFVVPRLGLQGREMLATARAATGGRIERFARLLDRWIPGAWGAAACETLFRTRGEAHKWMYDELSLADLMAEIGFVDITRVGARASRIPGWASYELDAGADGSAWKPVSLYMEARRSIGDR